MDLKKKHWVDFYHYRMDVYTLPTHIYVTWKVNFLHPMTRLNKKTKGEVDTF